MALEAIAVAEEVAAPEAGRQLSAGDPDALAHQFAVEMGYALETSSIVRGFFVKGSGLYLFAKGDPTELVEQVGAHLERKRIGKLVGRGRSNCGTEARLFEPTCLFRSGAQERRLLARKRELAIEVARALIGERPGEKFDCDTEHWHAVE